ncbi:unnamed protein product [Parnassius mnemosyne]|uniref:Ycf1 n=1 Tax=Parnassius mnemosyne TaxID=213953 RepID=A0AAV1KXY7_9NEOP
MSAEEDKNTYSDCSNIMRQKPNMKVTEEIARKIGANYRTLPAFEKGLFDYVHIKHYSLEENKYLQCKWLEYKKNFETRTFKPFQFPSHRDLHFRNGCIRFLPSESIHRHTEYRMKLKPGPGVDIYGQMPIPQELLMKRGKVEKDAVNTTRERKNKKNN